jgi:chitosanase
MVTNIFSFFRNFFSKNKTVNSSIEKSNSTVSTDPLSNILSKKGKIQSILNVFETGSLKGDYSKISIFADGPKSMRQITYGKSQTTEWGNLNKLVKKYVDLNGQYSAFFRPYLSKIGKVSLVSDIAFINKLKSAGKDPLMIKAQDEFFDETYWIPAMRFVRDNKFTSPLSALVIYDSYIHSGGILDFLRQRFLEKTPVNGGNEKKWIEQYLNTRQTWLANHSRPILRSTTYRTKNMLSAVKENNWNLDKPFYANGVVAQGGMLQSRLIGVEIE